MSRYRNRGRDIVVELVQTLLTSQLQLLPEQSECLIRCIVAGNNQLLAEVHTLEEREHQIPSELPLSLPPNLSLQAKKAKGNTRKRALTGVEVSEHQDRMMTRVQARARVAEAAVSSYRRTCRQNATAILEGCSQEENTTHECN